MQHKINISADISKFSESIKKLSKIVEGSIGKIKPVQILDKESQELLKGRFEKNAHKLVDNISMLEKLSKKWRKELEGTNKESIKTEKIQNRLVGIAMRRLQLEKQFSNLQKSNERLALGATMPKREGAAGNYARERRRFW